MDFQGFKDLIQSLGDGDKNTAAEVRNILTNLIECIHLPGDIKLVHCKPEELISDYTSTGLGKGKRAGWAICNGLNETPPFGGRVPLGWSDEYPVIGIPGGSKDAVLVEHSHKSNGFGDPGTGTNGLAINNYLYGQISDTTTEGESGVNKNLQPYLVTLYLMKLYPAI